MEGSQVLQYFRDVPDEHWLEIPTVQEIMEHRHWPIVSVAIKRSLDTPISDAQAAVELWLANSVMHRSPHELEGTKNNLLSSLCPVSSPTAGGWINEALSWKEAPQGHDFWREVHGRC